MPVVVLYHTSSGVHTTFRSASTGSIDGIRGARPGEPRPSKLQSNRMIRMVAAAERLLCRGESRFDRHSNATRPRATCERDSLRIPLPCSELGSETAMQKNYSFILDRAKPTIFADGEHACGSPSVQQPLHGKAENQQCMLFDGFPPLLIGT